MCFCRPFLLRDVYDDMILDGIQPISDTFAPLFVGCMKGGRLQDAFYFYDEMKCMGYIPDVSLWIHNGFNGHLVIDKILWSLFQNQTFIHFI